jgi:hypothetical protein
MRLTDEGWDQRQSQEQDQPRIEDHHTRREGCNGDKVLHLGEQQTHQCHATTGLAARALQFVLKLRILKIFQIKGCGMFHQPDGGRHRKPVRQQAVHQPHHPAQHVGQDRKGKLSQHIADQHSKQIARPPPPQICRAVRQGRQPHHLIHNQFSDPQRRHWKYGPDQAQGHGRHHQGWAGFPHKRQEWPYVAQRRKPRPERGSWGSRWQWGGIHKGWATFLMSGTLAEGRRTA